MERDTWGPTPDPPDLDSDGMPGLARPTIIDAGLGSYFVLTGANRVVATAGDRAEAEAICLLESRK